MATQKTNSHPLSARHFRQVVCRPKRLRQRMHSVWAITWRPGDHTGSFLGKLYRPIGGPVMMVQASYAQEDGREGIGLFGISARVDVRDATVSYDEIRLRHDFHRLPFVGARGSVLDPSDDQRGSRGNGSWVQLALQVDKVRRRHAMNRFQLPTVPRLPGLFFGYDQPSSARFEVTPGLRRRAAANMDVHWSADSLASLQRLGSEVERAQSQAFDQLPLESQEEQLRAAWQSAFVPPTDPSNQTGLWLLPHELSTDVYGAIRMFEYFGDLVGVPVFNPARSLAGRVVPNPAVDVAAQAGFDLAQDLAALADTAEGSDRYKDIEQRVIGLVPEFRHALKASEVISDQDLLNAICQPDQPVAAEPALNTVLESEQIRRMRERLLPNNSECCTDADILAAARNPNGPLFATGLCMVQTLHRDVREPIGKSLMFSPESLSRDRVHAALWQESWVYKKQTDENVLLTGAAAA